MPYYDFWRNKSVSALGWHWIRKASEFTFQRIQNHSSSLQHVVEIGSGRGVFKQVCEAHGVIHTAVDINRGFLEALPRGRTLQSRVPPLPLQGGVADAVVATHVIEHAPDMTSATMMLAEMIRITRPGGIIALTAPDLLWYGNYFWDCDYTHNFPTSARRLQQMLLDQRLEVVCLEYVYNHLTGPLGALVGYAARAFPYAFPGALPGTSLYIDPIYKSRLSFARGVFIVGRRVME